MGKPTKKERDAQELKLAQLRFKIRWGIGSDFSVMLKPDECAYLDRLLDEVPPR